MKEPDIANLASWMYPTKNSNLDFYWKIRERYDGIEILHETDIVFCPIKNS